MVLSNAERQRRHRERVKGKLATLADLTAHGSPDSADQAAEDFAAWIKERYPSSEIPAVISWLETTNPKDVIAALGRTADDDDEDDDDDYVDPKVWHDFLVSQFHAAGNNFLVTVRDTSEARGNYASSEITEAAIAEFLQTKFTALDLINLMEEAGQKAAGKIFERMVYASVPLVVEAPPVESPSPRRRPGRRRSP